MFHELLASNDTLPITQVTQTTHTNLMSASFAYSRATDDTTLWWMQILIEIHLHVLPSYAHLYPGTAASSTASFFEGMW